MRLATVLTVAAAIAILFVSELPADTIGWWRLGDSDAGATSGGAISTTLSEVNSPTLNATNYNTPLYSSDVPGKYIFDGVGGPWYNNTLGLDASGSNARIRVPNDPLLNVGGSVADDFTYEMFIKLVAEPSSYNNFMTRSEPSTNLPRLQIDFDHGGSGSFGKIRARIDVTNSSGPDYNECPAGNFVYVDTDTASGNPSDYTSGDPAAQGDGINDPSSQVWHHVALTYDASLQRFTIFTDHVAGSSRTLVNPFIHANNYMDIGKFSSAGGLFIDEARYSSGVLTPDQFLRAADVIPEPTTLLVWSLLAGLGVGLGWRRK